MDESEKSDYLNKKAQEEEEERFRLEEEARLREKELNEAIEEAKRIAAEEARLKAEYELRMQFWRSVRSEGLKLRHSHSVTRAFVFSYFDILRFLGFDVPTQHKQDQPGVKI